MNSFTYRELFDNMEKNGWPKNKEEYESIVVVSTENGYCTKKSYCALGQAGMNFNGNPYSMGNAIRHGDETDRKLFRFITNLNDTTKTTIPVIAKKARTEYKKYLDKVVKI